MILALSNLGLVSGVWLQLMFSRPWGGILSLHIVLWGWIAPQLHPMPISMLFLWVWIFLVRSVVQLWRLHPWLLFWLHCGTLCLWGVRSGQVLAHFPGRVVLGIGVFWVYCISAHGWLLAGGSPLGLGVVTHMWCWLLSIFSRSRCFEMWPHPPSFGSIRFSFFLLV